jgi:hypothetical protein
MDALMRGGVNQRTGTNSYEITGTMHSA